MNIQHEKYFYAHSFSVDIRRRSTRRGSIVDANEYGDGIELVDPSELLVADEMY